MRACMQSAPPIWHLSEAAANFWPNRKRALAAAAAPEPRPRPKLKPASKQSGEHARASAAGRPAGRGEFAKLRARGTCGARVHCFLRPPAKAKRRMTRTTLGRPSVSLGGANSASLLATRAESGAARLKWIMLAMLSPCHAPFAARSGSAAPLMQPGRPAARSLSSSTAPHSAGRADVQTNGRPNCASPAGSGPAAQVARILAPKASQGASSARECAAEWS